MAYPLCGTIQPDGTVTVYLTWTRATPNNQINLETVRLCVYGAGCVDYPATGRGTTAGITLTGLAPGVSYAWSVITDFTDGGRNESTQSAFTTPSAPRQPATNLVCSSP
jgi:hypothetical protein